MFKVGDIVTGVYGPYSVTNDKGKYCVCAVKEFNELRTSLWNQGGMDIIRVRVIEHEHSEFIGMEFTVLAKYFHKERMVATLK